MYTVKLYNNIAPKGLDQFTDAFEVGEHLGDEDAIVVRSANLHDLDYGKNLKAIARAGAGVNNIDLSACTERGIVVSTHPVPTPMPSRNWYSPACCWPAVTFITELNGAKPRPITRTWEKTWRNRKEIRRQ